MVAANHALPNLDALNHNELKALIFSQRAQLLSKDEQLQSRDTEIEHLKLLIAKLRRMQFGRKSEKLDRQIEQLELRLDELQATQAENTSASHTPAGVAPVASVAAKPTRKPLPEHLPREVRKYLPKQAACPDCGGKLNFLGEDISEILEYVPARFKVIRQVRPKLACACCERIVQAAAPSRPIERGVAGPGLLAHVLVSKYCDHLPLYRQSEIYAREELDLDRSTLCDWVGQAAWLLQPIVAGIQKHVFAAVKIHGDDTPVPVLSPGLGRTKTGRLWVYVRDDRPFCGPDPPAAAYFYSPDRGGTHPATHLAGFTGFLQADAYAGFEALYDAARAEPGPIAEVACWAHCRRKFFDVWEAAKSPVAKAALDRIAAFYVIEAKAQFAPVVERLAHRAATGPLLVSFFAWADQTVAKLSAKSALAEAFRYTTKRRAALSRFLAAGRLEADNNIAENALRGIALGRKNYLFAGADTGGERAAALYTIVQTAKLNGVNPQAYLRDTLARIADGHPINRIDELMPWRSLSTDVQPEAA